MPKFTDRLNTESSKITRLVIKLFVSILPLATILLFSQKSVFATTASLSVAGNADIVYFIISRPPKATNSSRL